VAAIRDKCGLLCWRRIVLVIIGGFCCAAVIVGESIAPVIVGKPIAPVILYFRRAILVIDIIGKRGADVVLP
jgi:hypothetical protein